MIDGDLYLYFMREWHLGLHDSCGECAIDVIEGYKVNKRLTSIWGWKTMEEYERCVSRDG